MKTNNKKYLTPRLRFPEFQNSGEWEVVLLEKLIFKNTKRNSEKKYSLVQSISNKHGFINQDEYFDNRQVASMDTSKYYVVDKGTFAYKNDDNISIISPLYVCFKCNREIINDYFLLHWFDTNSFKKQMTTNIEGGVRNTLNFENLIRISIPLPTLPEQQKIADFLSNLDEWLAAEEEKLTLLETYKKGLLQNLFPAEGETVPKFRFPEFQNSGAWEVKRLGEVAEFINGLTYSPEDIRESGLLVLRSSNIQSGKIDLKDSVFVRSDINGAQLIKPKDILICVRNGSKNLIGKSAFIPDDMPISTHGAFMVVIRAKNPEFVFQLLQTDTYFEQVKAGLGATINSINLKDLKNYKFYVPRNLAEQQKIADCLSALDEQIEAQRQKVEQLREHKKGLLQGLFPQLSEL